MQRLQRRTFFLMMAAGLLLETPSRADVPVSYKGTPFDPAVAGGAGVIPPTVKAGPYAIPGRLDLINYDLGGQPVAYSVVHHETKNGAGYRTDQPVATFSLTAQSKMDVWYDTGSSAIDGTFYPSATTADFYDGALDANDYFNYTVDVQTAGTYTVSTTFASGNGPPGGEGGDGTMGLQISVNGTMMVDWKDSFPDFATKANYHNWKPYPAFATLTLDKGLQVLKVECTANHLNLDYLQFALAGAGVDGGASPDAAGGPDGGAIDASGAAGEATGTAGASGTAGVSGTAGAAGGASGVGGGGAAVGGTGGESGVAGASGAAGAPAKGGSGGGCSYASSSERPRGGAALVAVACVAILGSRARRRRLGAVRLDTTI